MGFTITCDKCGNKLSVVDKGVYTSEKVDLFPSSDCDGYTTEYTLDIFCNNKKCENHVEIRC